MTPVSHSALPQPELPLRVKGFLDAIINACNQNRRPLVSIVLFGSAAKGGFAEQVSDVDLIVVVPDNASREERARVQAEVHRIEVEHGFREPGGPRNPLQAYAERMGNGLSSFVCRRNDLVSGDVARVFDLRPAEAFFVDRIVLTNVIVSSVTVWGEDLLSIVHLRPVRRLDVFKAWFSLSS